MEANPALLIIGVAILVGVPVAVLILISERHPLKRLKRQDWTLEHDIADARRAQWSLPADSAAHRDGAESIQWMTDERQRLRGQHPPRQSEPHKPEPSQEKVS